MTEVGFCDLLARSLIVGSLACATATAQTQDVRISGRVVDPSGAAIPKACVTLKGAGSAGKAAMFTNDNGEFTLGGLAPGTYDLSFSWRFREYDTFVYKPRSLTFKADRQANVVPPAVLEIGQVTVDYDFDALHEYQYKFLYGSEEVHNQCSLNLDTGRATCPSTSKESVASNNDAGDLRLEADGQKLLLVPLNGAELAFGDRNARSTDKRCPALGYSPKRLRIDNLPEANLICGRTKGGRQVELAVGFKEQVCIPGGLIISFETRRQQTDR
jgi:hypothetical protein